MSEQFLYEQLDTLSEFGMLKKEMPDSITQNLHPKFELRPYQVEAFARFIHCLNNDFPSKRKPLHLLFNMATGSGKTLIMAGLILYLYEQGYRNFLFFVNADN
ncbi:type III deoxyribonuclease, partial [Candidatus Poribacteria bacterium]|nr:type III deoxyribonuclease [Candidatus Poribacteria bacterium]